MPRTKPRFLTLPCGRFVQGGRPTPSAFPIAGEPGGGATQFHPEKIQGVGLQVLKNFVDVATTGH
jgi:hypothetical protein